MKGKAQKKIKELCGNAAFTTSHSKKAVELAFIFPIRNRKIRQGRRVNGILGKSGK